MVDTHTHLHFHQFDEDRKKIVENFEKDGISFVVNVGVNLEDSKKSLEISSLSEKIFCAVGVHPHDAKDVSEGFTYYLEKLARSEKVVAIGETGLDFFRNLSPAEIQKKVFIEQIALARRLNLPLVVHIRDAYKEAYEILKDENLPERRGVIHAFSSNLEWAKRFINLGFFLGIGGPVTYPKNDSLREAVRRIGLEFIVLETDCPFLPPQPLRGKRNEPKYLKYVMNTLSEMLGVSISKVDEMTTENAIKLFKG
ncbi:TatD family hydrolase [Thermotoga sp. KOL6]|uniref:TatD family hydrolase n=1 Tax=Thermotoga sp. KOL6 TaxID=126741 RepID=UPI000C7579C9|nr:TatD family hydrolase [Thermotoga sp. KOL6]PLV59368.1 hydrolase TatD [Thermotoga sp. KOL6]